MSITFDDEEVEAAGHWYGGQGTMLYAIVSTGALNRGTHRPRGEDGHFMTDDEWWIDLAERLESEAEEAARDAAKQAKKAKGAEKKELLADVEGLRSIAHKAEQFLRERAQKKPSHATRKKPRAQLDREIAEVLTRPTRSHARKFAPGDPNNDDFLRHVDDISDLPRTALHRSHADERSREINAPRTRTLSAEQLAALRAFAKAKGRSWKAKLNEAWMTGNYKGAAEYGVLQTIRNMFGPTWLEKFSFDRPKTHAVKR